MSVKPLTTAIKCFDLLEQIAGLQRPARLAELARLIGESRATTYQRLFTLTMVGWLERLPDDTYRLSLRACRIANAAMEQAGFGERALPTLQQLTDETGETSSLVALEDNRLVIAQRVEARGVLRADLRVGAELSYMDSASGKIWLAYGPQHLTQSLSEEFDISLPQDELEAIRGKGYAVGGGGATLPGIAVIAAPVFDDSGQCLAALSLVGPEARFDDKPLVVPLLAAVETLTHTLAGLSAQAIGR